MSDAEQMCIEAIRQAARDSNKKDAKLLRKIIEEEMRKKVEVLRESLVMSNECVRKCGHDWSE